VAVVLRGEDEPDLTREDLGAAGVNLFCLVVPPLRIRGASGSPLRMLALAPK